LALRGEKFDGHNFLEQAVQKGALGLIAEELPSDFETDLPCILVEDTLKAYQELAHNYRLKMNPQVIAVTGSNGKTSTKEMLKNLFELKGQTQATYANENNEIGVPKTIFKLKQDDQFLVAECGMRGLGQIELLSKILSPDLSLITSIGTNHIGVVGSREKIAQAKCEIFVNQKDGATAVIPSWEALIEPWKKIHAKRLNFIEFNKPSSIEFLDGIFKFTYRSYSYQLRTLNIALLENACAVIEVGLHYGFSPEEINSSFAKFEAGGGRGKIQTTSQGALLLDESYNASIDSVIALSKSINAIADAKTKVLILGQMAEMGDFGSELLKNLSSEIKRYLDTLILIGDELKILAEDIGTKAIWLKDKQALFDYLETEKGRKLNSQSSVIGVKASRVEKFEEIVLHLTLKN
jgi:UDP-N-acetylmuramoyl-tripeptide--D-alanyl-D-alanine ligase